MELEDTTSTVLGPALASELGITYRQLHYWCQRGYISERLRGSGRGGRRALTVGELERLRDLVSLSLEYQSTFGRPGGRRD